MNAETHGSSVKIHPEKHLQTGPKRIRLGNNRKGASKICHDPTQDQSEENYTNEKITHEMKSTKTVRKDRKGHLIIKGGKKHIVSFADIFCDQAQTNMTED